MNTIKFLLNASSVLQSNNLIYHKINSNMLNSAFVSSTYNNLKMGSNTAGSHVRCQYCHTEWRHNNYSYKFSKIKRTRKRRKHKSNMTGNLNEKEKEAAFGRVMLVTCFICNKTTKHRIIKQKGSQKEMFDVSLSSQSLNTSNSFKTPNKSISKPQQKNQQKDSLIRSKNKKLQQLCYQTTEESSKSPGDKNNSNSKTNTSLKTPIITSAKKKKQRDRFAGLLREACIASSTPKQKSNLQLLLKEKN